MTYKVFLVEDEIATREGIRDAVDWPAAGYQFCGEAPDGEIALPLIRERRPETVITDIKMPFMDGLQLCRILRETLPATKIIILSGHDEFKYAQEAIQIGVTEYLLKPIVPQDLVAALRKVARQIDEEHQTSAHIAGVAGADGQPAAPAAASAACSIWSPATAVRPISSSRRKAWRSTCSRPGIRCWLCGPCSTPARPKRRCTQCASRSTRSSPRSSARPAQPYRSDRA